MKSLVVLALMFYTSSAWFYSKSPEWNGLKVGYGIPLVSPNAFDGLPRTTDEAVRYGWELDSSAAGCGSSRSYFAGNRYIKNGDPGAMLLFDKNGYIAGIQAGIPKNRSAEYPEPMNARYRVFNEESKWWVITAYFVEPDTICSEGRTEEQFDSQGTGYMLAFQTGSSPSHLMRIPMDEEDVLPTTKFVAGKCFYAMGMHYWYDRLGQGVDRSCDDLFPVFLLYDSNERLTGFGWAFNLNFGNSSFRWEHPHKSIYDKFMNDPPRCLGHNELVSTLHVYFTRWPQTHVC